MAMQLEETSFGLICLTRENIEAPWILFEAGALSKTLDRTYVCPYLFNLDPSDLKGPLVQFQLAKANKEDTKKLVLTINRALGPAALADNVIEDAFEIWWPKLEISLNEIRPDNPEGQPIRSDRELLEEMLELTRTQVRKAIDHDKDPLYKLLKTEINDFKSHIMNTMTNKDAAVLLEESRLDEEIQKAGLSVIRLFVAISTKGISGIEYISDLEIETDILSLKAKLDDLKSKAQKIKPSTLKRINYLCDELANYEATFLKVKTQDKKGQRLPEQPKKIHKTRRRKAT